MDVERARHPGPKPHFQGQRVTALVDAGLLRWVNACRSAAVLTEEGKKKARATMDELVRATDHGELTERRVKRFWRGSRATCASLP